MGHEALGLLATAASSVSFAALVLLSDWLEHHDWPALGMLGLGSMLFTSLLLILIRRQASTLPLNSSLTSSSSTLATLTTSSSSSTLTTFTSSSSFFALLFLRGFFSVFATGGTVLATFFGCPAGDALAIASGNVFASAVAGAVLFGEAFGPWKARALVATALGALLVSKPQRP